MSVDRSGSGNVTQRLDIEDYIIELLTRHGKMTTRELQEAVRASGRSCPDEPVRYLTKLRMQGTIKGQISMEYKCWLWWV